MIEFLRVQDQNGATTLCLLKQHRASEELYDRARSSIALVSARFDDCLRQIVTYPSPIGFSLLVTLMKHMHSLRTLHSFGSPLLYRQ